ncbi:MAG: response regulator [Myxococcales bacterium]
MSSLESSIAAIFRVEVSELLDTLGQGVERLRALPPGERAEPLSKLMRVAHNIKGVAASVGISAIERLAHASETALKELTQPEKDAGPAAAVLLEAVTAMQHLAQGKEGPPEEIPALVERLLGSVGASLSGNPAAAAPGPPPRPESPAPAVTEEAAAPASVRVETRRLDLLMEHTGELLATHARQAARVGELAELRDELERLQDLATPDRPALVTAMRRLDTLLVHERRELEAFGRLTRDLGSAIKRVRMLPLEGLAPSWRLLVRESAQQLGRQVELAVEVGDIELDKHVLDRIRDPLIHLLRNAVAHGIEAPGERKAAGKPAAGQVRVRATAQGTRVQLEVSDDGRGLDPARIGEAAVRKGLVSAERLAQLAPDDTVALIFEDGFSTAQTVDEVSGRGVGMSVARSQVQALGGQVQVAFAGRVGACFTLTLPVSVVSRRGLLVRAGKTVYALPIDHVLRTARAPRSGLERTDGRERTTIVRDEAGAPVRGFSLAALMGQREEARGDHLRVVILEHQGLRFGVFVDEVLREEDYVTKPLPSNLEGVRGVDGAVILADGSLAVAIDVAELARAERHPAGVARAEPTASAGRKLRVLVVDDVLTTRTLHRGALEAAGCEVSTAADGEEAWEALQRARFDVLVSDVQMPRLDGFGLTGRVRAQAATRDLPVILVSALDRPEDLAAGASAGANEYLVKSHYEVEKLVAAVKRFGAR